MASFPQNTRSRTRAGSHNNNAKIKIGLNKSTFVMAGVLFMSIFSLMGIFLMTTFIGSDSGSTTKINNIRRPLSPHMVKNKIKNQHLHAHNGEVHAHGNHGGHLHHHDHHHDKQQKQQTLPNKESIIKRNQEHSLHDGNPHHDDVILLKSAKDGGVDDDVDDKEGGAVAGGQDTDDDTVKKEGGVNIPTLGGAGGHDTVPKFTVKKDEGVDVPTIGGASGGPRHLDPPLPYLPAFVKVENSERLIRDTLSGKKPTIAGIAAYINVFFEKLHAMNIEHKKIKASQEVLVEGYFNLAKEYLQPFDKTYRGREIFDVRKEEDSIFVSLAAFREHLLAQTMKSAFDNAEFPEKIFFGVVVQNCFGMNGLVCRTGAQVIGKNKQGRDMTKVSDKPPDVNGIEQFCTDPNYVKYCESGQVRAVYMHENDVLGPAVARYFASKLWGGETYFMQMDSHLEFASNWDTQYVAEVKAAKSYPKAVLSSYPPGFSDFGEFKGQGHGARLCTCVFTDNEVENHIIRINTGTSYHGGAKAPTQVAFIAAGFFFAPAEFLIDVPFDPYLPWCFMGEEIALSIRAWTAGWDIYAPRKNLIAHQYRPGRMGLPKFWGSVGRGFGHEGPGLNNKLQKHVIRRVKLMVGYTTDTRESIESDPIDRHCLADFEHYSLGTERTREQYYELTGIDPVAMRCGQMKWCNQGTME